MLFKQFTKASLVVALTATLVACGGGSDDDNSSKTVAQNTTGNNQTTPEPEDKSLLKAQFVDSVVQGLDVYQDGKLVSTTDKDGYFYYNPNQAVQFKVGQLLIGETDLNKKLLLIGKNGIPVVTPTIIAKDDNHKVEILVTLQSLDNDRQPDNGIVIAKNNSAKPIEKLPNVNLADTTAQNALKDVIPQSTNLVLPERAKQHYEKTQQKLVKDANTYITQSPADVLVGTWQRACKKQGEQSYDIAIFTLSKVNATTVKNSELHKVYKDANCSQWKEDKLEVYDITLTETHTPDSNQGKLIYTKFNFAGGSEKVSIIANMMKADKDVFYRVAR